MAVEVFKRKENKYLISRDAFSVLEEKLAERMEPDEYNKSGGNYTICNIYYDTKDHHMIRNSLSKPKYKEKLRLRSYGVPQKDGKVFLEIKKKVCGVVNKRRTQINLDEAYEFVSTGLKPEYKACMNKQVLCEIEYLLKSYHLEPKLYLAYDRKAFFSRENPSLRITFDTNIRTRREVLRLEEGDHGELLLEGGLGILEIKTEGNIPLWLSTILAQHRLYSTSFSKYGKEYQSTLLKKKNVKGEDKLCLNPYSTQPRLIPQYL